MNYGSPGPRFECADGEGTYFCVGVMCEACDGAGVHYHDEFWKANEVCEACDGDQWVLLELEGIEAIIAAREAGLLCLPPIAICAGIERRHDIGCQDRPFVACAK